MKETLSLCRDFTRFFNDFQFPHSVRVCVGEEQMLCSGALLAQQSTVIEKVIREDNGVLMFEELLDVPNGCQEHSKDLLRLQKSFFEGKILEEKTSNVWVNKRKRISSVLESLNKSKLHGHALSILNKITPQNFKELSVQMLQLKFDSMKKIDFATELIHKKAIMEPPYIQTYANLCKIMGSIVLPEEQNAKVSPFRKRLLNLCQREFFQENSEKNNLDKEIKELHVKPDITEKERQSQLAELIHQRSKLKAKMLGNAEFIGELFNLGMLSSKIIISQCMGKLLAKEPITEDAIECLAKLYSTTGLKLENELDDELKRRAFIKTFSDFKELGSNPIYSNRIRFMVQDVVELRENNWVPRRVKEKPQRIEEIHRMFFREEQKKELEAQLANMKS